MNDNQFNISSLNFGYKIHKPLKEQPATAAHNFIMSLIIT